MNLSKAFKNFNWPVIILPFCRNWWVSWTEPSVCLLFCATIFTLSRNLQRHLFVISSNVPRVGAVWAAHCMCLHTFVLIYVVTNSKRYIQLRLDSWSWIKKSPKQAFQNYHFDTSKSSQFFFQRRPRTSNQSLYSQKFLQIIYWSLTTM